MKATSLDGNPIYLLEKETEKFKHYSKKANQLLGKEGEESNYIRANNKSLESAHKP